MAEREFAGKCKRGLYRKGCRVYVIFEFPNEYDAMEAFDVWGMEKVDIHHEGPVVSREEVDG